MPHRILQHRLDAAGLSPDAPPDIATWKQFLSALNQDLRHHSEQQALYRAFFNQSHDAVAILDLRGMVIDVNDRMIQLAGFDSASDMIGQPAYWFQRPGEDQTAGQQRLSALVEGRKSIFAERELKRRDGTILLIEGYVELAFDERSDPLYLMAVMRDISHHRTFQEELARSAATLNDLLTDIPVGVLAHDQNAKIIFTNPAAYEVLGLTEDQFLGRTSIDSEWNVVREDGSDFPGAEHPASIALSTGQPIRDVLMGVYRPATHDRAWILVNAIPQFDPESNIKVLVTFTDVTAERKAAEHVRQLKTHQELLERSHRLLESIGHDFRTPLSVIGTSLYLLKRKAQGHDDLLGHIEILETQSQRINWLVDEALLMSRLDSGLVEPALIPCEVKPLVVKVIHKLEPSLTAKTQNIELELEDNLPIIQGDHHYLSLAIEQVLLNANLYTPSHTCIRVSAWVRNDYLQLVISDNGDGMDAEQQARIFERLYKANEARTEGGSGLGLPIVKEIMNLHGGSISVESVPGKGSAFTLRLPILADAA